jgi:polysaccharide export outer membrane protein
MNKSSKSIRLDASIVVATLLMFSLAACGGGGTSATNVDPVESAEVEHYLVGAGDGLQVFVWGHPDLSTAVAVRPDGLISTPLVEDMQAAGKTPTELAREIENSLSNYVRSPTVTVIVQNFVGEYDQQIRVVGQAAEPTSIPYRSGMTVLDVMIAVGGLAEFASGNKSRIVRRQNGEQIVIKVRLKDLLNKGDMRQNVRMRPGDVLIIPESAF